MNYTKLFFVACVIFSTQATQLTYQDLENQLFLGINDRKHGFIEESSITKESQISRSDERIDTYVSNFLCQIGNDITNRNNTRSILSHPELIQELAIFHNLTTTSPWSRVLLNNYYWGRFGVTRTQSNYEFSDIEKNIIKKIIRLAGYNIADIRMTQIMQKKKLHIIAIGATTFAGAFVICAAHIVKLIMNHK